jgi:Secretion system C-terminal sorting domain/Beta-propeller repeat
MSARDLPMVWRTFEPLAHVRVNIMKQIFTLFLAVTLTVSAIAQVPTVVLPFETRGVAGFTFHPSPLDGYIATVQVEDSVDLNPGGSPQWVEPITGYQEVCIVGYADNGTYLWHQQLTSTKLISVFNLSFVEDGQFYLSGTVSGVGDADPDAGVAAVSCNCSDGPPGFETDYRTGWYGKFTATGELLWHEQVGGTLNERGYSSLHYSPFSHDLFVFGTAMSPGYTVDFDPGASTAYNTPQAGTSPGVFVNMNIYARLDSNGTFQWSRQFGGAGMAERWDDGTNEYFYVTGSAISGSMVGDLDDFDPGTGVVQPYTPFGSGLDVFASKLDANGDLVWCKFYFGTPSTLTGNEQGTGIAVDPSGNAYVAGVFESDYPNVPGGSELTLATYGGYDALLLKLNGADGSLIWEKQFGSPNEDMDGASCALDDQGGVYVSSGYTGTAELNMSNPSVTVAPHGPPVNQTDAFVACFDSNGAYQWSGSIGGPDYDGIYQLLPHGNELCVLGTFVGTADLDLGPGTQNHTSVVGYDPFFACYDLSGIAMGVDDVATRTHTSLIYPNPASGIVQIGTSVAAFEVFDALGQQVLAADGLRQFDVSSWMDGIYFLKCTQGDPQVLRLIVQH